MFAAAGVSPSSTTAPPTAPPTASTPNSASPNRPSRLRGLSALRNYTQHHLSLHHSQPSSPTSPGAGGGGLSRLRNGPLSGGALDGDRRPSYFASREVNDRLEIGDSQQDMPRRKHAAPPAIRATNAAPSENNVAPSTPGADASSTAGEGKGLAGLPADQMPTIRFLPYQDPRSSKPSLAFPATSRTLPHEECVIRVGRYSERDCDVSSNVPPGVPSSVPVGFKSKVVSRRHCEFWCSQGQWYVKDVKSSSGTFLNHIRLSQPSVESRPFPVHDGDVVQLGIDFRGGEEQIFRCVKIRVECNRAWQQGLNNFNKSTHKRLKALSAARDDTDNASNYTSECSICLMSIAPCQSLFVAPCSHVWHFRCIRPILMEPRSYPQFLCPNCRAVADLEADIDEVSASWAEDGHSSDSDVAISAGNPALGTTHPNDQGPGAEQDQLDMAIAASLQDDLRLGDRDAAAARTGSASSRIASVNGGHGLPSSRPPVLPQIARTDLSLSQAELTSPTTPGNNATIALSAPPTARNVSEGAEREGNHDGPLTPRNEAGPFIFDAGEDSQA